MGIVITSEMLEVSKRLATLAERLNPNPEIEGFHLTWVSRSHNGSVLEIAQAPIGTVRSPGGGPEGIRAYSNEKALRAAAHRLRDPDALSSWQTSDSKLGMYQGAVIFPGMSGESFDVISVSAYEEPMDEAVALIIGQEMRLGDLDFANRIVTASRNEQSQPLHDAFYDIKR